MFSPRRQGDGDPLNWRPLDKLRGIAIRGPGAKAGPGPAVPEDAGPRAPASVVGVREVREYNVPPIAAVPAGDPAAALDAVLATPSPKAPPAHIEVQREGRIRLGDIWRNSAPTEARLFALELAKVAIVVHQPPPSRPGNFFALSGLRGLSVALSLVLAGLFCGNAIAVVTPPPVDDGSSAFGFPSLAALASHLPLAAIGVGGGHTGTPHGDKVDVCHRTGHGGSHTITVDLSAWMAHFAHGDSLGACVPGGPGGNGTDPGGNETDPGGNETDPGGNETDPGGNETDPGGNETDPGGNETGNQTGPGGGSPPGDVGAILRGGGGGGGGSSASGPAAPAAPAAASGAGGGGGGSGGSAGPSASPSAPGLQQAQPRGLGIPNFLALGTALEASSGRKSLKEGAPHGENEDQGESEDGSEDAPDDPAFA